MNYKPDSITELNDDRLEAISTYIWLQEDFKKLNACWILTSFTIYNQRFETEDDIDNYTEEQNKEIDRLVALANKKAKKTKMPANMDDLQEYKKTLPMHEVEYNEKLYIVAPYFIWDIWAKEDSCLDALSTDVINLINTRISARIEIYKEFITK